MIGRRGRSAQGAAGAVPLPTRARTRRPLVQANGQPLPFPYWRLAIAVVLAATFVRLFWLSGNPIDLYPDEAQYWIWSRTLDWGYYSKPPLVAWLIRLTTDIAGNDSVFSIKLGAPATYFFTSLFVFAIARRLYGARVALWSCAAFVTLPAVSLSSAIISTDVPLLFFWAAGLFFFVRALDQPAGTGRRAGWANWIGVGVAVGLGLLSKYAMGFWAASGLLWLALNRQERRHLPRYLASLLLGFLIYSPNLVWNWRNGFVAYLHTSDNANLKGSLGHPDHFLEFFGSQFGVFGPIFFVILILVCLGFAGVLKGGVAFARERPARLLLCFGLPTLLVMLVESFLSRAQPNWSAPTYVSMTVLVVAWAARGDRMGLVRVSIGLHVLLVGLLVGARSLALMAGISLPVAFDPLHRLRGWAVLGDSITRFHNETGLRLMSDDREVMASLIYYVQPHPFDMVKFNVHHRITDYFDMQNGIEGLKGQSFLLVTPNGIVPEIASYFEASQPVAHIVIPNASGRLKDISVVEMDRFKGYDRR